MTTGASLQVYFGASAAKKFDQLSSLEIKSCHRLSFLSFSSCGLRQDMWSCDLLAKARSQSFRMPYRCNTLICRSISLPVSVQNIPLVKNTSAVLTRSFHHLLSIPLTGQLVPAVGIVIFSLWGLVPLMQTLRSFSNTEGNWKKSQTYHVSVSYIQPLLLWAGATLICRALDPVTLPTEAGMAVKLRVLNFVRALSTVVTIAYCLSSFVKQTQKFFVETAGSDDTRNMGFQFAGRAIYTGVWVAAFALFMELLGFSTQKWVTAGGLGTVLLTLAGREIFTNFLSSVMIHATRPFVLNEWIQTKIEGYEVSGTVEHVGWWSPTIIRGDDREAVHIPNHKFTVSVVRNLSQKTHWRIKTHLAISHLDVGKINNIVADMRKVLAKNPQIEQQRLHRRVFLENIDPENQALLILISCFVKTSHFEEYLCVKEAVLLDLLRVISHHGGRLATPIRTVQKFYGNANIENIPYGEDALNRTSNRPFLLIESPRINGDEKAKSRQTPREEPAVKSSSSAETKSTTVDYSSNSVDKQPQQQHNKNTEDAQLKSSKSDLTISKASSSSTTSDAADNSSSGHKGVSEKPAVSDSHNGKADGPTSSSSAKTEPEKPSSPMTSSTIPSFEDNIVLGVALEGSKRTLPIEGPIMPGPSPTEVTEQCKVASSPSMKDKKDQISPSSGPETKSER